MPKAVQVTREGETKAMFRVRIRGTVQAVWAEITRTDAPIAAFFNSRMHVAALAPGSKIAMRTPDGKWTGVVGEILEFDPPRVFAHSFRFTNYDDPACAVRYELEPDGDEVVFTLTISDLPAGTKSAKQMLQGGVMICNTLKSVIETGRPSVGTRMLFVVFRLMAPLSPRKCLSANWPVT